MLRMKEEAHSRPYAFKTGQFLEVQHAYRKVRVLHPSLTHAIAAYYLRTDEGYQDDGEYGASHRLLKMLKDNNYINTAVFVVRAYGGRKLGLKRHEIIKKVAEQAVQWIGK